MFFYGNEKTKVTPCTLVRIVEGGKLVPGVWINRTFYPVTETSLNEVAGALATHSAKVKVVDEVTKKFRALVEGLL